MFTMAGVCPTPLFRAWTLYRRASRGIRLSQCMLARVGLENSAGFTPLTSSPHATFSQQHARSAQPSCSADVPGLDFILLSKLSAFRGKPKPGGCMLLSTQRPSCGLIVDTGSCLEAWDERSWRGEQASGVPVLCSGFQPRWRRLVRPRWLPRVSCECALRSCMSAVSRLRLAV